MRSVTAKSLKIDRSKCRKDGPYRLLRGVFPIVPRGGMTNAAVLNHSPMLGLERVASAIWFGRVGPPPIPLKTELAKPVKLSVMVNGLPEFQIRTELACHPASANFLAPSKFLPNGNS